VWEIDIITENRLACEGGIEEVMTRRFDGVGAVTLRDSISGMASADREVWAKEDYRAVMGDKVEPQVTFNGIDEVARPLLLSTTALWPGSPTKEMTEYREADSWLVWYAGRFRSENRHHPYSLGGARIVSRTVFHLCPDRRANFTGASLDMRSEFGNLSREYHVRPDGVEVETCLELPRRTIEVGELDRFRRFLNHALDQTQIWFSLVGGEP